MNVILKFLLVFAPQKSLMPDATKIPFPYGWGIKIDTSETDLPSTEHLRSTNSFIYFSDFSDFI